jgi:hypothetical protein
MQKDQNIQITEDQKLPSIGGVWGGFKGRLHGFQI